MKKRGYKITSIHFSDNLSNKYRRFSTRFMKDLQNFDYYDANFIKSIKITQIAKNNLSDTFRFPSTSKIKILKKDFIMMTHTLKDLLKSIIQVYQPCHYA